MAIETFEEYACGQLWTIQVHPCDDCGWKVEDLENRIDVEWWSDDRCGCFRRGEGQ